jgi:hypothetical protein
MYLEIGTFIKERNVYIRSLAPVLTLISIYGTICFALARSPISIANSKEERYVEAIRNNPHVEIARMLNSDRPMEIKMAALSKYVRLGDLFEEKRKRLGRPHSIQMEGAPFCEYTYDSGLIVACYPNDEVYGIGYYPQTKKGQLRSSNKTPETAEKQAENRVLLEFLRQVIWLAVKEPVVWPKPPS